MGLEGVQRYKREEGSESTRGYNDNKYDNSDNRTYGVCCIESSKPPCVPAFVDSNDVYVPNGDETNKQSVEHICSTISIDGK